MPERTNDAAASEPESPTPATDASPLAPDDAAPASTTSTGTPPDDAAAPDDAAPSEDPRESAPPTSTSEDGPAEPAGDAPAAPDSSQMPEYKGEPLDAERGPGLGCFWIQIGLLTFFLIFTPLTVTWGWDPLISGALLIFTLILLLFSGQTIIFLLRLVAADRRTRRAPLNPSAKPTVGQMEDAGTADVQTEAEASAPDGHDQPEPGGTHSKGDER